MMSLMITLKNELMKSLEYEDEELDEIITEWDS
jgi:hypothetical protein